jgi:hypothetical protein
MAVNPFSTPRQDPPAKRFAEDDAEIIMPPPASGEALGRRVEPAGSSPPLLEASITTGLGGLFYLINLGLYLGLYGDFTTPRQAGISLPVWDFMALVGRRLLGDEADSDPLWQLLAQLSGRGGNEEPGRDFEPPECWRMPPEWLTAFPGSSSASSLEHWLDGLMPCLLARLKRALGVSETERLTGMLCRQTARVAVSAAHVDVFFALDEHPIEIRLAGLDRNPGWLPAAGRFIRFHYE